jgi:succinate dehydrogenase / fumarate reductase cytochrome b subunit
MGWLRKTINTSIGKKTVMAVTGLGQGLFVAFHLAGNSKMFQGRAAFTAYAEWLRSLGGLVHLAELLLLTVFLTHIGFGLNLFWHNRRAKPVAYAVHKSGGGRTWGSRTMPYSGLFFLLFLLFHLAEFRFSGTTSLSDLVRASLAKPPIGIFYLAALLALGLHLSHGLWSSLQSLGLNHPKYESFQEYGGVGLSAFITTLFCLIPLLALFWPGFLR